MNEISNVGHKINTIVPQIIILYKASLLVFFLCVKITKFEQTEIS